MDTKQGHEKSQNYRPIALIPLNSALCPSSPDWDRMDSNENKGMHLAHVALVSVFVAAGMACSITSSVLFYQILDEVNSKRPPERRLSLFDASLRGFVIKGEHEHLFPESRKPKRMGMWALTGSMLFLIAYLSTYLN